MSLPGHGVSGSDYGSTPVEADEVQWLARGIHQDITRSELDSLEEQNIEVAYRGLGVSVVEHDLQSDDVLDDVFLRDMHRQLFCDVWLWAGRYRTRELSIGIDPSTVALETRNLMDDARAWLAYGTFSEQEIAVRLSHGITRIHPFPNSNGRLSRLYVDILEVAAMRTSVSTGAQR